MGPGAVRPVQGVPSHWSTPALPCFPVPTTPQQGCGVIAVTVDSIHPGTGSEPSRSSLVLKATPLITADTGDQAFSLQGVSPTQTTVPFRTPPIPAAL